MLMRVGVDIFCTSCTLFLNKVKPIPLVYGCPSAKSAENVIVQYGHDRSSFIDILGYCMNVTAKLTSLTNPDKITIGKDVYDRLHPEIKVKFTEVKYNVENLEIH